MVTVVLVGVVPPPCPIGANWCLTRVCPARLGSAGPEPELTLRKPNPDITKHPASSRSRTRTRTEPEPEPEPEPETEREAGLAHRHKLSVLEKPKYSFVVILWS